MKIRWPAMRNGIAAAVVSLALAAVSFDTGANAQAVSQSIDTGTLYIIFLHLQASDAQARASVIYRGPNLEDKASRLGVRPDEIKVLDDAARAFVTQEESLRQKAISYSQHQKAAGQAEDSVIVRSFTTRREALANAAFANLRSAISPASYSGLQQFLNSAIRTSVKSWR